MRRHLLISILFASLTIALVGCRLPSYSSVPASLATSRRLSQEGIASLEQGQQEKADALLAKAVKTCPTDPDARRYYAETLWLKEARPEAVAQLNEVCRLSPEDAGIRVRLAEMHLAMGRLDLARQSVEQAIGLNPHLATAWAIRGRIMRATGDLQQALADDHRALSYAPDDRQILLEIAETYRQTSKPQRALETLQSLLETYSPQEEPQQVLYLQGLAYVALKRYDDAVESFATAAARDRPTPEILCGLAQAQWLAGRTCDAATTLQQSLALDPAYPPSRELLGQIEVAQRGRTVLQR